MSICPSFWPLLTPSLWSFCELRGQSVSMLSSSSAASAHWLMCRVLSISARASSFTVSHTDSNSWGSWEISPPSWQSHELTQRLNYRPTTDSDMDSRWTTGITIKSLNLQHRNECREDFGFGPLHQLLVSLQDALQDEGEGRQDVRSCRYHTGDGKRSVYKRQRCLFVKGWLKY